MIANILRKDIRLLWPLAALVAAIHLCAAIPHHLLDQSATPSMRLALLGDLLSMLSLLSVLIVVVVAMHQDAVPGVRQDWLTRPIRRRDLILSKLAFVLLLVQAPLWLVDVGAGLADGFSLWGACVGASERNFVVLCQFALPAMMIGAITRNFVEAFIVAAAALIGYTLFFQVTLAMMLGVKASVAETGAGWLIGAAFYFMAIVGAAVVLCVQYIARRTILALVLVGLGGALILAWAFMPWRMAFGLQQALSSEPMAARSVQLAYAPQLGRYRLPPGAGANATSALYIPLQASGVPEGGSVLMDHADVRISAPDGALLYRGKSNISVDGLGSMLDAQFEIRTGQPADDGSLQQRIYLPAAVIASLGDRPVKIAIDESMTLFKPDATLHIPAVGARAQLGDLGHCATRVDQEGDDVQIACLSPRRQPSCVSARLEDPKAGLRNPQFHRCFPNYAPVIIGQLWPDAIHRTGGELQFFDRSGLVHFPVDGSKLGESRISITTYSARDHFTRHIDTPLVRLPDLAGVAGGIAPPAPAAAAASPPRG